MTKDYEEQVKRYNNRRPGAINYLHWDMQHHCSRANYGNVSDIIPLISDYTTTCGFFLKHRGIIPRNTEDISKISTEQENDEEDDDDDDDEIDGDLASGYKKNPDKWKCLDDDSILRKQIGVFRVNCMDCLDRYFYLIYEVYFLGQT